VAVADLSSEGMTSGTVDSSLEYLAVLPPLLVCMRREPVCRLPSRMNASTCKTTDMIKINTEKISLYKDVNKIFKTLAKLVNSSVFLLAKSENWPKI
jgi:hypothetical protein